MQFSSVFDQSQELYNDRPDWILDLDLELCQELISSSYML